MVVKLHFDPKGPPSMIGQTEGLTYNRFPGSKTLRPQGGRICNTTSRNPNIYHHQLRINPDNESMPTFSLLSADRLRFDPQGRKRAAKEQRQRITASVEKNIKDLKIFLRRLKL